MLVSAQEAAKAHPRRRVHVRKATPDLDSLPGDALMTHAQLSALSGFAVVTHKLWTYGREGKGLYAGQQRGPAVTRVEGRARYRVSDVKAWLAGQAGK